jgi:hypothetical protein
MSKKCSHLGRKKVQFALDTNSIEVGSVYFLFLVTIGRVFQLFGLFFEFENCLRSLARNLRARFTDGSLTCASITESSKLLIIQRFHFAKRKAVAVYCIYFIEMENLKSYGLFSYL